MSSALELVPLDQPFDLYENGRTVGLATAISMLVLSIICMSLRFCGRFVLIKGKWAWDDTLILIAFAIITPLNSLAIWATMNAGFGQHALLIGTDTLRVFLKATFAFEILFYTGLAWTRYAVIALYWRLFKVSTWIRRALLTMVVLNTIWWIVALHFVIFTCTPVWSLWIWEEQQSCLFVPVVTSISCVSNIFLDLCVIMMPITVVRSLNMPLRKKYALGALFGFSLLIPVISGFRLNEMLFVVKTNLLHTDPSFAMTGTAVWCMIESSVGVCVACVPSMRPVFRWLAGGSVEQCKQLPAQPVEKPSRGSSPSNGRPKTPWSVMIAEYWTTNSSVAESTVLTLVSEEKSSQAGTIAVSQP